MKNKMEQIIGFSPAMTTVQKAEAILALPEMKDMQENAKAGVILAEHIRNAAVKAGIAREDVPLTGPQLSMLCNDLADFALSNKGKAEKWDLLHTEDSWLHSLAMHKKQLDLLMHNKWVREKCKNHHVGVDDKGALLAVVKGEALQPDTIQICPDCKGTGFIEREATVEELREMIECPYEGRRKWLTRTWWEFTLKSRAILTMKGKK